jgi:membrane protein
MTRDPSMWKLGGLSIVELGRRVWSEVQEDEVTERAAALSYYFLFSLFPALLFLVALLGFLPLAGLQERLLAYAREVLPPAAGTTMERTLHEVIGTQRPSLVSIGILVTLWAGSNGLASVMSALNIVFDAEERRPWWKRRLLAIVLTIAFSAFIVAALTLIVFGPKVGGMIAGWLGLGTLFTILWNVVSIPVVFVLGLIGIQLVYYLAPAGRRRWRWITPGGAVALGLWLAMSFGLRFYVTHFGNYSATYGSIGGVILLLLWLYLTSVVMLVGGEVDAEIKAAARERHPVPRDHPRPARRAA